MALTNSQFNSILRGYEAAQNKNAQLHRERTEQVYAAIPEYEALEQEISRISVGCARRMLSGDEDALSQLHEQLARLRERKKSLLKELLFPDDYLEPVVTQLDDIDFFWHTTDVPGKGLAYTGITLIPPASMPEFIAVIENIGELSELKTLLQKAWRENKWVIHYGL